MFTPKCFFRIFVLQNVFRAIFALHSHILHDVDTYIVLKFLIGRLGNQNRYFSVFNQRIGHTSVTGVNNKLKRNQL